MSITTISGAEIRAPLASEHHQILSDEAVAFVVELVRKYRPAVKDCLAARRARQLEFDAGAQPGFLPETREIRDGDWHVATIPADLTDRRVEITGPVDRKMVINALNAPVRCYMADFEDSQSPTWEGLMDGQVNLRDAVAGTIAFTSEEGRHYQLAPERSAVLIVRPRGWHLPEKHVHVDGERIPGALWDFGLHLFHTARARIEAGSGPYFYLPKLQSHLEARLWNEIFVDAQDELGIARGTIKATVLIETVPAAFEMDEILYELRDHAVGLNCGRWDYIFSYIKTFRRAPERLLPDRHSVGMDRHFLDSYSKLLCRTCHRRGAAAIGGMAAFIPVRNDDEANALALDQLRQDKEREVRNGHDGSWIAHPDLAAAATEVFDAYLPGANQIEHVPDWTVGAEDLLRHPDGAVTEAGLRQNISIGLQYLEAWISGNGCVPLYNLMEDAATAEISRAQVWQQIHHPDACLDDGRAISAELVGEIIDEEMENIDAELGEDVFSAGRFAEARKLFAELCLADECAEFLTLPAYELLD